MLRQTRGGDVTSAKTDAVTAPLPVCLYEKCKRLTWHTISTSVLLKQFNVLMIYPVLHTVCFKVLQILNYLPAHDAASKGTNLCYLYLTAFVPVDFFFFFLKTIPGPV